MQCIRLKIWLQTRYGIRRHNTTGEVSNILFEDIILNNASTAISISADYGGSGCPCKWMTDYGGPEQRTKCHSYGPSGQYCSPNQLTEAGSSGNWAAGCTGVGGICGPEGNASNSEYSGPALAMLPHALATTRFTVTLRTTTDTIMFAHCRHCYQEYHLQAAKGYRPNTGFDRMPEG